MTAAGTAACDRYWEERDLERAAARSRARAAIALRLLEARRGQRRGALLEIGCGPGWALEAFRGAGFEASGIDISPRAIELARARGLDARLGDATRDEIGAGFDVLAALEVLEHVADPLALLGRMARALLPGGHLVVSLPNEFSLVRRLAVLFGRPGFGGHDDPHLRHFDPAAAARLFRAAGLNVSSSGWDGLAPPRWRRFKRLTDPLAALSPGLFAIAGIHLLEAAP